MADSRTAPCTVFKIRQCEIGIFRTEKAKLIAAEAPALIIRAGYVAPIEFARIAFFSSYSARRCLAGKYEADGL